MMATAAELLKRFGPPDRWLLSVDEIEQVMTAGPCRHLLPTVGECRECVIAALTRRQLANLASRLGLSSEDARAVSDHLVREYLEEPD